MPSGLHFEFGRRPSTKSHVDTVPAPVIHERDKQRAFSDLDSVYAREADASTAFFLLVTRYRLGAGQDHADGWRHVE